MSMAPPQPVASAPYVPHVMTAAPVSGAPMMTWSGPPAAALPSSVPHVVSTHEVNAAHYLPPTVPPPPPASQPSQYSSHNSHSTSTESTKQKSVVSKKRYTKAGTRNGVGAGSDKPRGDSVTARRQKRLERNRESARLSRRRRKQYLEVLEDRVTHLSIEMDAGRREHAARAIETVLAKRQEILKNQVANQSLEVGVAKLENALNRASRELLVLSTFQTQQLKSFSLAPHTKFVMWLTLQGDTYFRGGRAASERLSAARIGERVRLTFFCPSVVAVRN
jgi:hypothetical protein